jgi:hypothetical protein
MCFKFGFESLGGAVAQFVLGRFTNNPVSTLSLLLICYGISQVIYQPKLRGFLSLFLLLNIFFKSLGSMLVSQLIRVFRASSVISVAMMGFSAVVSTYILLEFFTGGTLHQNGNLACLPSTFLHPSSLVFFLPLISLLSSPPFYSFSLSPLPTLVAACFFKLFPLLYLVN